MRDDLKLRRIVCRKDGIESNTLLFGAQINCLLSDSYERPTIYSNHQAYGPSVL